jgi:hypothetical protein
MARVIPERQPLHREDGTHPPDSSARGARRLGLVVVYAVLALLLALAALALVLPGVVDRPSCLYAWHLRWVYDAPEVFPKSFCAIPRSLYTLLGGLLGIGGLLAAKRAVRAGWPQLASSVSPLMPPRH